MSRYDVAHRRISLAIPLPIPVAWRVSSTTYGTRILLRQANRAPLIMCWKVRDIYPPFSRFLTCLQMLTHQRNINRLHNLHMGLIGYCLSASSPLLAHSSPRLTTFHSPGVYWLQDPRSRVYNFTPWLETIPKVTDFDFERVTGFIRSSQDNVCLIPSFLSFHCPQKSELTLAS